MWAFIGIVAGYVWDGVQAAMDAIVWALQFAVHWLFVFVMSIASALKELGLLFAHSFTKIYQYFRDSFLSDLKAGWTKFWGYVNEFKSWLKDTIQPVLDFLRVVRDEILCFYKTWIRPILDVIDATRAVLKVLEDLGVEWAAKLDNYLALVESAINRVFAAVLSKLNEVIDVVNSVVTFDLLFQRSPFLRTLMRDIHYANAALLQARLDFRTKPTPGLGNSEKLPRTPNDKYAPELAKFYRDNSGAYADEIPGLVTVWRQAAGLTSDVSASTP